MQNLFLFLAGIALFIFAMHLVETGLKKLSGRGFKLFLRRHTNSSFKAVFSSTILTTLLQSSSVVIMTTLSFVGAGIVTMRNALAVTLCSNIGTTLGNWIIAIVGFKMDIAIIALPLTAIGSASVVFTNQEKKVHHAARLILGFGFFFLGLNFMKESMSVVFEDFDFTRYEHYPAIVFVLIGFIMTGLIQSSSATVAILLSALHTGGIPFEPAVAAVIGSELGTALKVILGSINGSAAKRQMAIGNFVFNIIMSILALIFINPLIGLVSSVFGDNELLLRLVLFQTVMNAAGVILFLPFIDLWAKLLEKYIRGKEHQASFVVESKLLKMPEMARDALEQDTELLIHRVMRLNLKAFATEKKIIFSDESIDETLEERNHRLKTYESRYEDLKKSEGEILIYTLKLVNEYPEHAQRSETLVSAIRHAMHSAKAMKDVYHNRIEFHESADDVKFNHYIDFRKQLESFYEDIDKELRGRRTPAFEGLINAAHEHYNERRNRIFDAAVKEKLGPEDVSSLLNVNRELYTSCKTIVQALQLFHGSKAGNTIGDIP